MNIVLVTVLLIINPKFIIDNYTHKLEVIKGIVNLELSIYSTMKANTV